MVGMVAVVRRQDDLGSILHKLVCSPTNGCPALLSESHITGWKCEPGSWSNRQPPHGGLVREELNNLAELSLLDDYVGFLCCRRAKSRVAAWNWTWGDATHCKVALDPRVKSTDRM